MELIKLKFQSLKKKYPSALLLFKDGEQYTAYGHDAEHIANATGAALRYDNQQRTSFIEFPERADYVYFARLVKRGYKMAIIE